MKCDVCLKDIKGEPKTDDNRHLCDEVCLKAWQRWKARSLSLQPMLPFDP